MVRHRRFYERRLRQFSLLISLIIIRDTGLVPEFRNERTAESDAFEDLIFHHKPPDARICLRKVYPRR